jgi:hypothetical protein
VLSWRGYEAILTSRRLVNDEACNRKMTHLISITSLLFWIALGVLLWTLRAPYKREVRVQLDLLSRLSLESSASYIKASPSLTLDGLEDFNNLGLAVAGPKF